MNSDPKNLRPSNGSTVTGEGRFHSVHGQYRRLPPAAIPSAGWRRAPVAACAWSGIASAPSPTDLEEQKEEEKKQEPRLAFALDGQAGRQARFRDRSDPQAPVAEREKTRGPDQRPSPLAVPGISQGCEHWTAGRARLSFNDLAVIRSMTRGTEGKKPRTGRTLTNR